MTITTRFRRLKYLSPLYREPSYLPPVSQTDAQKRFRPQRVFRSARRAIPARSFQPVGAAVRAEDPALAIGSVDTAVDLLNRALNTDRLIADFSA